MVRVIVDSRVRLDPRELPEGFADELRALFTHKNPKREQLKRGKVRGWWNEPALIATWTEAPDGVLGFPRGGMSKVRDLLRARAVDFKVVDMRRKYDPDPEIPDSIVALREYQQRLVDAFTTRENCLGKSGTGSGKTTALLALYARLKVPTLVLVHQVGLAEQWAERAVAELGMRASDVGLIGSGKHQIRNLTIGIPKSVMNMVEKDPSFLDLWGAVFVDEVHLFAAQSLFACVDLFPARYRIGASDDEKRKDQKEFLLYDLFGAVAAAVTDEELVGGGHVMGVEVLLVPTEFEADWYVTGDDEDKRPDYGVLLRELSEDPARNEIIERILATEIAEGRQAIVFARERDHCRAIATMVARQGVPAGFLLGGPDYREEFRKTKAGLKSGATRVGVGTYQACGVSLDVPSVEIGICAAPCLANRTTFRQARGRVCRKPFGKTVARLYIPWDRKVFGLRHLENASRWNPLTFVWDGGTWVPAKAYLKRERIAAKQEAK